MKDPLSTAETFLPAWALIFIGAVIAIILLMTGLSIGYQYAYADEFYPGVSLGTLALGGKTPDKARQMIADRAAEINRNGFLINYQNHSLTLYPAVTSPTDPDVAYDLYNIDVEASLSKAWSVGRSGLTGKRLTQQLRALLFGRTVLSSYQLDKIKTQEVLEQNLSQYENPGQNAKLLVSLDDDQISTSVQAEKSGQSFNYGEILQQLSSNLADLENRPITVVLTVDEPTIFAKEVGATPNEVAGILARGPWEIYFADQKWSLDKSTLAGLLGFRRLGNKIAIGLDQEKFADYVLATIAPTVERPAQDAKFAIKNGRVSEFVGSQSGQVVDVSASRLKFEEEIIDGQKTTVELVVTTTEPEILTADVNDLGIKEIIGLGKSNFAGSPANRRHNIATGAAALNGLMIKPGEEFSLLKALGTIDGSTGYLQELVIKGNKTTPEYGGGLCQIGTTTFRGVLDSGLPITARRNHSYQVSYYAPAGTDATIYDPAPDFKFVNDTGHYILLVTKIIGDDLRFEFWGTKDGRKKYYVGQQSSENFYDITPKKWGSIAPAPTKYIETLDLPVGQQKCTEKAHAGVTASFDYKVTYPDGQIKDQEFTSVYRPWQAVCLVGVEKLTEPVVEESGEGTTTETPDGNLPPPADVNVVQ